jgi:hypothetical protein
VAASNLALVFETLAQLDRQLVGALGQADILAAHGREAKRALDGCRRELESALETMAGLRRLVLGCATGATIEWQEATLRARTVVVLMQLAELKRAEEEVAPYRGLLYTGRFSRLVDVNAFLLDAIGRINEQWLRERSAIVRSEGADHGAAFNAAYLVVLKRAEVGFAELANDHDVVQFLRLGSALDSERFQRGCRLIAMLLDVSLAGEKQAPPTLVPRLDSCRTSFAKVDEHEGRR